MILRAALFLVCACAAAQEAPGPSGWRGAIDRGRDGLAGALGGLQLSAFGDALAARDDEGRQRAEFDAFELDGTVDLTEDLQAAAAGVAARGNPTRLTVGFLDWHPFGGQIAPRGRLWVEKGFHVEVGRFDVPFGNDWEFYASKDSASVSRPLTTAEVMDGGYNDAGVRVLGNDGTFNFNAYLLRGFNPGRLVGGRIGFTPLSDPFSLRASRESKPLELGLSWFYDATSDWRKREAGGAADVEGRRGPWYGRAEYVVRQTRSGDLAGPGLFRRGWHFTQELALDGTLGLPSTAFLRYERTWTRDLDPVPAGPDGRDARVAAGLSATFLGILQAKAEGQHFLSASAATRASRAWNENLWLLQLVAVF